MFREITRKKQALSREESVEILKSAKRGVLAVIGDDGYPYAMPLNHLYSESDGHLYFHTGRQKGHRLDAIQNCGKVSFCVMDEGQPDRDGPAWSLFFRSVIVFGQIRAADDPARVEAVGRELSHKFTDDEEYIEYEIRRSGPATILLELIPEHITGKLVHEA